MNVIVEHCRHLSSIDFDIHGWFHYSSYHMPLFMFAAGYFFKEKNLNYTTKYIFNKFKKLIIPTYLYNLFYGFFLQFLKNLNLKI